MYSGLIYFGFWRLEKRGGYEIEDMHAGLGGCPSCALLRQRTIYPASVTALPNQVLRVAAACSSTGQRGKMWHGANNNGHSRWDRRESFWNKWERRSQQHFWQEVALEEDKRSEAWRSPIKSKVGPCPPALAVTCPRLPRPLCYGPRHCHVWRGGFLRRPLPQ